MGFDIVASLCKVTRVWQAGIRHQPTISAGNTLCEALRAARSALEFTIYFSKQRVLPFKEVPF